MEQTVTIERQTINNETMSSFEKMFLSYDPSFTDQICCIELPNNNHVYIHYDLKWKIKDLINRILSHKGFKKLYSNRVWQKNASSSLFLFDLHLAMYRNLKQESETKIDFDIELADLKEKGLLKNPKCPFFLFKDNRNNGNLITSYEEKLEALKTVKESEFESYTIYKNYLPRVGLFNIVNSHPELGEYYQISKQGINYITKINLNSLINEKENADWFTYDDESLNFMASLEAKNYSLESNIKYLYNGEENKLFFEDKYSAPTTIIEEELQKIFVSVTIEATNTQTKETDFITKKVNLNSMMTGKDLLDMMNKKLQMIKLGFDPSQKILKVRSLNDYIININCPLIKYAYINDCVAKQIDAEYYVLDNPFLSQETEIDQNILNAKFEEEESMQKERTKTVFRATHNLGSISFLEDENIKKLFGVASFKPTQDKKSSSKILHSYKRTDKNDPLEDFTKALIPVLNKETENVIEETSKLISEDNSSMMMEGVITDDWGVSTINQSLSMMSHSFHPIPRKTVSRPISIKSQNIKNYKNLNSSKFIDATFTQRKKNLQKEVGPNVFEEEIKTPVDTIGMIKEKNEPIRTAEILLPFSIVFRDALLYKFYNSFPDRKNSKSSVLYFKFQIFLGSEPFSKPVQIKWTSNSRDLHPCFNKRLYFDISYSDLPHFATLVVKLKHVTFEKENTLKSSRTIGWANYKLFDHKKYLNNGVHQVNLFESSFNDNSFYCYIDNVISESNSLFFEIDSFASPVYNEIVHLDNFDFHIDSLMISDTDKERIKEIKKKNPFDSFTNYDKELIWSNRYSLSQDPSIFSKVLMCVDYKNPMHRSELERILLIAKQLSPIQSMELLTGKFLHESIRKFAVKCLASSSPQEVQNYLIQLVQGLKFEQTHDNDLGRYLLNMAINYPLTIGHSLFWCLRVEMYNPIVQQRFGLYLEVFLTKIGRNLCQVFEDESWLVNELNKLSSATKKAKNAKAMSTSFNSGLEEINKAISEKGRKEISLPINFKYRAKSFKVKDCQIMKGKKKHFWLSMENSDPLGEDIVFIFKSGDDLRMDIITLQLFKIIQALWLDAQLRLKMTLYNVVSTGYYQGMIEVVKKSENFENILKKEGGPFSSSKEAIVNWLGKNCFCQEEEYRNNFLLSVVAYSISTFILGIGERSNENIMVKSNGEVFHIGFGHILGSYKYKKGNKNEKVPFPFPKQFLHVLGGEKSPLFSELKKMLYEAFKVMRKNPIALITLLRILICSGVPEISEKAIRFLDKSLCLDYNEEQGEKFFKSQLSQSLGTHSVSLEYWERQDK